jgi:gluconolactonase
MIPRTLCFALILMAATLTFAAADDADDAATTKAAATQPDPRFLKLLARDAKVEKLAGGMHFIEGPVWTDADGGYLVFSDIPANELKRWDAKAGVTTFRTDSHGTNGNTRDRRDRLISCEHTSRRVTRTEKDGTVIVLADLFVRSKKFNSPNDVVVKSDGTIWFTDPTYGLPKGEEAEIGAKYVFCLVPDVKLESDRKMLRMVTSDDDFDQPNGLAFSPDESKLYIADSGRPHHIMVFDVKPVPPERISLIPWRLVNGRKFCVIDKGVPDGIRCDAEGNVWSSAGDGVQVFAPDGTLIGKIPVPESPANLCFGGADGSTLFITARTSLYSIKTNVRGAKRPTTLRSTTAETP